MIGNKKHFLVAGATGLVGKALVEMMLENDEVGKITLLVRRPIELNHQKLQIREINFESYTEKDLPPNVDAVFCCLGTTMAQAGGKDAFRAVDYAYVVKLAVFTQRQKIGQFHVVSSSGANANSKLFYAKVKGRMELEVKKLTKMRSIYIYRPSMLLGDRDQFRLGESVGKFFMKTFSFVIPKSSRAVYGEAVAYCMLQNGLSPKKGVFTVSNKDIIMSSEA